MKKIVSLMALCAVLFGVVLMATGCGSKPAKGSVWEVTTAKSVKTPKGGSAEKAKDVFDKDSKVYYCFHADGNVYVLTKDKDGKLEGQFLGGYKSDKSGKLIFGGNDITATFTKDKMTMKSSKKTFNNYTGEEDGTKAYTYELKPSKAYSADEIKARSGYGLGGF